MNSKGLRALTVGLSLALLAIGDVAAHKAEQSASAKATVKALSEESAKPRGAYRDAFAPFFAVGAALSQEQILGQQPGVLDLVAGQFNSVTAENDMKWERIEPKEGQFDFTAADQLFNFARDHDIDVVGHVLLWHSQTPDWVFENEHGEPASRALLLKRLENHINAVAGRYRGQVQAWDVVNEALNEDGSLRDSPWRRILGENYIATAFQMAHAADPDALLVYNDYNLFKPEKRAGVVRLVHALKAQNIRIDAVGLQGHYSLGYPDVSELADSIQAFAELGVKVMITELDVSVLPFPDEAEQGADISQDLALNKKYNPYASDLPADIESAQSDHYAAIFRLLLDHATVIDRVTFWGVADSHSWRNGWPMKGRTDYPLTFARGLQAKDVHHRLIEMARTRSASMVEH